MYYELLVNLMFEIRHSNAPGNVQDLFQDISDITLIILDPLPQITFTHKVPKIWNEMPVSLRKKCL